MTDGGQQVDLSQLFSDVSRTVSGIRDFLGRPVDADASQPGSQSPLSDMPTANSGSRTFASGSPLAGIFGGSDTCFKACGAEEVQFAAKRAGELFVTLRTCAVITTEPSPEAPHTKRTFIPKAAMSLFQRREAADRDAANKPTVQVH
ncbi:hypothetical protein M3Y99_01900100 [Aphelenchoides fujianensis]|nr:hypothetical protein M3Y99_01900100 [Aphelenchoides fujianensis]